jgi:hypothetical protein
LRIHGFRARLAVPGAKLGDDRRRSGQSDEGVQNLMITSNEGRVHVGIMRMLAANRDRASLAAFSECDYHFDSVVNRRDD